MWFPAFVKKWATDPSKATAVVKVPWNDFVGVLRAVSDSPAPVHFVK